ncbi:MAG TPA: VWA domain-containing protein [Alphaproteobacteria bacterium]|nr:VWA domain-containing protein [Alphaproteobacteria bacterium]
MIAAQPEGDVTGVVARLSGFMAHLRVNGFAVGPGETEAVLTFLAVGDLADARWVRLGLKTMLSGDRGQWERFEALFDAYWFGRGVKRAVTSGAISRDDDRRPDIWRAVSPLGSSAELNAAVEQRGQEEGKPLDGAGQLAASRQNLLARSDLRRLANPDEVAEAERIAERLARAIRYRLSRRRVPSARGRALDLRRSIRRNLSKGGEPFELIYRRRPDRPVNLVLLLDVSGSMKIYSRFLICFVRGLLGAWLETHAFVFHTRLVHISDVLREHDRARAMDRLSLMVEGFGGGTQIASALKSFNDRYAREVLNSRSIVIMMSDGYDTDPVDAMVRELARLKQRARRLVWLNPLLGWRDYAPVARSMAAAMPYIDCFAAAHSLESLAALEAELCRL